MTENNHIVNYPVLTLYRGYMKFTIETIDSRQLIFIIKSPVYEHLKLFDSLLPSGQGGDVDTFYLNHAGQYIKLWCRDYDGFASSYAESFYYLLDQCEKTEETSKLLDTLHDNFRLLFSLDTLALDSHLHYYENEELESDLSYYYELDSDGSDGDELDADFSNYDELDSDLSDYDELDSDLNDDDE